MTPRLNPFTASPTAMQPWIELGKTIQTNGLEPLLRELVMMRASQINGCAFCIHITLQMLASTARPRTGFIFSARGPSRALFRPRASRAGLDRGSDAGLRNPCAGRCYEALRQHFTKDEQVKLTLLIAQVNAWNRIKIGFRAVHPAEEKKKAA